MSIKVWRWGFIFWRFAFDWTTHDCARLFEAWKIMIVWLDQEPTWGAFPKRSFERVFWIGRSSLEQYEGIKVGFFKGLRRAREQRQGVQLYRHFNHATGKYHDYIGSPSGPHSAFCWCPNG